MPSTLSTRAQRLCARVIACAARGLRPSAICVAALLLAAAGASAHSLGDDFVESWTTRDGLPHSTINGIGQTSDGFLWLATWEGIARYDGHDFRLYRRGDIAGLGDDSVRALHVGPAGDLWAGSARGGIVRWHGGRWDSRPPVDGLITDLLEEPDSRLWVATARSGVVRIDRDGARRSVRAAQGLPSDTVNALARDARGAIWVATSQGLARIEGDHALPVPGAGLPGGPVFSLFALPDGRLLVGTEHGAFLGDARAFAPLHAELSTQTATRVWRDADGIVWVGTNNGGLARVDGHRIEWLDTRRGLPNNRVLAIRRDGEGSLWVGTNGGLVRLRAAPVHTFTQQDGLSDDFVRATLAARDGTLWIGSGQGLDRRDPVSGAIRHVGLGTRLADVSVLSLAQDANGDILAGTFHDGVLRIRDDRVVASLTMADGLSSNEVRAVLAARDGRLWIGTKQGVIAYGRGRLTSFGAHDGLPAEFVQALYEDATGAIWIGTASGMAVIRDGHVAVPDLRATDAQYVYAFLPSGDGRAVWAATDRGLLRVPSDGGAVARIDRSSGLPFEKIFAAITDRAGRLWLTGNQGVAQLRMADVEAAAAGRARHIPAHLLGRADGMISAQANGGSMPAAALDADGRLWVATAIGVARVDPAGAQRGAQRLPPISIERFEVDGREIAPSALATLPPGDHRIVVRFVAPALLNAQRVAYRYRLDGLSPAWIDLGASREVQFTHLDPRGFRLRLRASVPGEAGASETTLAFRILPYWWQRPSVLVAAGVLALLLLAAAYAARIRRMRRTEQRLRALVDERTAALQVQTHIAERLARTDALTRLANRRALDQALDDELLDAVADHSACLVLVDVDGFKPINDLHGHAAGDLALRAVADVIRGHAREQDVAARWGGDEFALLLVGCTLDQAMGVAERIRGAIVSIDTAAFAPGLAMSASIGVACSGGGGPRVSLRMLVPRADEALFRAKREGRNRVRAAVVPEPVD
jgi:diguanylate cyclase (GGDEF)-like protein